MNDRLKFAPHVSHEEVTAAMFRDDPAFAAAYVESVLEDGTQQELLVALKHLARAFGGVPAVARSAGLNVTTLYRTLAAGGNPELRSLVAVLKAMGLRLSVQPIRQAGRRRTRTRARKRKAC
jgi:probable addiction module antidote protein